MGKEKEKKNGPPGTGCSLIIVNLPPLLPSKHTSNSPILLRHWLAWRLRKLINSSELRENFKTLGGCSTSPLPALVKKKNGEIVPTGMPGHIQIHSYDNPQKIAETGEDAPRHGYMGLSRCGSATCCPSCGARIRYVRRNEIQAITEYMVGTGHSFLFQTLTAPHSLKDDPKKFVHLFQEANREMKKGKGWKAFAKKWGLVHYIRSTEITDDAPWSKKRSGVHWHSHTVLFFKRAFFTVIEAKAFRDEMATRWTKALLKVALIKTDAENRTWEHGVDIQRPKVANQGQMSDPELIQQLIEYVAKGASFELSPTTVSGKEGRKKDRITFWQLMQMALTDKPELQWRLLKLIEAQKGRAHLYFSPGLKAMCGLQAVTDEEIMRGEKETLVYAFDDIYKKKQWRGIKKHGQQKALLVALDESANVPTEFLVETASGGVVDVITGEVIHSSDDDSS